MWWIDAGSLGSVGRHLGMEHDRLFVRLVGDIETSLHHPDMVEVLQSLKLPVVGGRSASRVAVVGNCSDSDRPSQLEADL
jgi:hypothetical protein